MTSTTEPGVGHRAAKTRPAGPTLRRSAIERRRARTALSFLAPAAVVLSVFVLWPMLSSLWTALTDRTAFGGGTFVGAANFTKLFHDERFINAAGNTIVYALVTAPISVGIALVLALLLNRRIPGRGAFRTIVFFPYVVSLGIVSMAWAFLLDPNIGAVSSWLNALGISFGEGIHDPHLAMPAVMLVGIWRNVGFFMVLYLAGLQSIPTDIREAAKLDGASGWRHFRSITWPLLSNTSMFVVIIAGIFAFQAFDQMYVMTNGGPFFSTETLVMLIYVTGVQNFDTGYASAMSWALVAIVLSLSLAQVAWFNKRAVRY